MEARRQRLAVLVSGRGSNMEALAQSARSGALAPWAEIVVVACNRPEAPGLDLARSLGLPTLCLPSKGRDREAYDAELAERLAGYRPDWVALAGYLRILSPGFVRRFAGRIVNIHPADTREHQGLHGYRWAFERGLAETKVTVHLVDEGLDTGRIVAQRAVDLRGAGSLEEVERRGLAVEHALYPEAVAGLMAEGLLGGKEGDHQWVDSRQSTVDSLGFAQTHGPSGVRAEPGLSTVDCGLSTDSAPSPDSVRPPQGNKGG